MFKKMINRILIYIYKDKVNIIQSLIINLSLLPLKEAIRFPVIIYGKCKTSSLTGLIKFQEPIKTGMLKIGISDLSRSVYSGSYLSINGTLLVNDNVVLRKGIHLNIQTDACLKLGNHVYIGDNCSITVKYKIIIKENTRIGNNVVFMDTDFHYIINTKSFEVKKNYGEIEIGKGNWIGAHCVVKKNTKTPNYTIVTGPYSILSKDYTKIIEEYSCIGGSPAKLIAENLRRINNNLSEDILKEHFDIKDNNYILNDFSIDLFCSPIHK